MNIFDFHLTSIFSFTVSPLELMLRGTLMFWSFMLDFASFRFPLIQRFTSPPRLCLEADGEMSLICKDEPRVTA